MNNSTEKKPNILRRALAFLVMLALVLGAVAAVAYRDRFNLDALKRFYTYRTLEKSDSGQTELFSYEGRSDDLFADLDGDLLVCTPTAVHIYSPGGVSYLEETVSLSQPALTAGGGLAAVYDTGGHELRVFDHRSKVFSLTLDTEKHILAATLNSGGLLAVTSEESGYKGVVTVYDSSYRAILSLRLSSRFLMDGIVTEDGKSLAALSSGLSDGSFESSLLFYRLSGGEEPFATCSLGNNVVLSLDTDKAGLWALGENALSVFSSGGEQAGQYSYDGLSLKNASLGGESFAALILGKYRAGNAAELITVDGEGAVISTLPLSEQILSLSACGKYVAVLTADRLDIYTRDLTPYASLEGTQGARAAVLRDDGSATLIGSETARLYLPN